MEESIPYGLQKNRLDNLNYFTWQVILLTLSDIEGIPLHTFHLALHNEKKLHCQSNNPCPRRDIEIFSFEALKALQIIITSSDG